MAGNLREVITAARAERRAKVAAAYRQKLIAKRRTRQLKEAKRVMELDRNLIVIAVLIIALPIIAALAAILTGLAVVMTATATERLTFIGDRRWQLVAHLRDD